MSVPTLLFHDLHIINTDLDGKSRCIHCGMLVEEIAKYETLFCPASNEQTFSLRACIGFCKNVRAKYQGHEEEIALGVQ